jgi:hypothetical protein
MKHFYPHRNLQRRRLARMIRVNQTTKQTNHLPELFA